jgi:hypothetical protein
MSNDAAYSIVLTIVINWHVLHYLHGEWDVINNKNIICLSTDVLDENNKNLLWYTSYILTSKQHFRFILFWRLSPKKTWIINSSLSKHLKPTEKNMTWCRWLWHYFYQGKLLLQINRWIKNYMKTWHMQSYTHEKYVLWCIFYCEGFNFFFRSIYDQYIVLTIYGNYISSSVFAILPLCPLPNPSQSLFV